MRSLVALAICSLSFVGNGYGQLPDGRLLWSMDSMYVLVSVDDREGIVSRRGLANQVQHALTDAGVVVADAAVPGLVIQVRMWRAPSGEGEDAPVQLLIDVALTDNVTRVKYIDAALTRCMSAEGCRNNVEGARALGSRGILWRREWLGTATADAAPAVISDALTELVTDFLAAHAAANPR